MKHAVQIRRCSGARRDNHFRFRSSFVQPPPARRLSPFISNRKSLRRVRADDSARRNDEVIHVTHRKQTTDHHSNRENNGCFSNHNRLHHCPSLKISNREPLRWVRADDSARRNDEVIRVTHRKQTTDRRSNREINAYFSNRVRLPMAFAIAEQDARRKIEIATPQKCCD